MKTYLLLNLVLLISAFIWKISTGLWKSQKSSKQELRIAQLFVLMSLLAPSILIVIPMSTLPAVEFNYLLPKGEGSGNFLTKQASRLLVKPVIAEPQVKEQIEIGIVEKIFNSLTWQEWIFAFISLGFIGMCARFIVNLLKLRQILKTANVYKKIGSTVIAFSENITVPFSVLFGMKAWVILPFEILSSQQDFKSAVRHEVQHHRQKDTHWALFYELVQCVFYLNPATYLWKNKITEFQELSCDEALIGQSKVSLHEYASCLVRVAEIALRERQMYAGTACMAANSKNPAYFKSFLRRRIEMLSSYKKSQARSWVRTCTGTVAIVLTMAVAYGAEQTARTVTSNAINPGIAAVDEAIQQIADRILTDAVKKEKASAGFAIVAEPSTGRILAIANFDSKNKDRGQWAQSLRMEAASIGKSIVAAEAIEKGLTTPQEKHACENGNYVYGNRTYHDWKRVGWDFLTTEETITNSSDICSMKIGEKIGPEGLYKMLVRFGFGPEGTAKGFPGAMTGLLPPEDYGKPSSLIPFVTHGSGYKITPIEMLQAYGAIANGGNLMAAKPATESNSQIVRRVMSLETSQSMKEILRQVVVKGTGKPASSVLYTTAGKTASGIFSDTRKIEWLGGKETKADYAGFIGFAPVEQPQVLVFVGIRDPESKDGAHGSEHAAPVFKQIAEAVLLYKKVAPDKSNFIISLY